MVCFDYILQYKLLLLLILGGVDFKTTNEFQWIKIIRNIDIISHWFYKKKCVNKTLRLVDYVDCAKL